MLEKSELLTILDSLGLPQRGITLVMETRIKAPVRDVASHGGNVITVVASSKMQREIRTESRHLEFFAAISYEHDARVLEYYPQPCELKLDLLDETKGEPHSLRHVPDFLVIRHDGISLIEWKSVAKLERLAEKYPWRYQRDADGYWRAPQIERQLAEWGLDYRIQTDADISPRRMENLLALMDYFHPGANPCPPDVLQCVHSALQEDQALFLAELYDEPYGCTPDQLLKAIADQELVADLERESVTEPSRCRVYRDSAVRDLLAGYERSPESPLPASYELLVEAGTVFVFEGQRYEIALVGDRNLVITDASGKQSEVAHDWLYKLHEAGRIITEPKGSVRQGGVISGHHLRHG